VELKTNLGKSYNIS